MNAIQERTETGHQVLTAEDVVHVFIEEKLVTVPFTPGMTVGGALREAGAAREKGTISVNEAPANRNTELKPGDLIAVTPLFANG